jgi:hypothetical protein
MKIQYPYIIHTDKLLPTNDGKKIIQWHNSDNKDRFLKNSANLAGTAWPYHTQTITYNLNSQGYRTDEWEDINWAESIVLLGCSFVLGEGLAESDTMTAQLRNITGRNVINLGVSGSSMLYSLHNLTLLLKNFPTPWAVVQVWTSYNRMHVYQPNVVGFFNGGYFGPYNEHKEFFKQWAQHPINPSTNMWMAAQTSKLLCQNKTRYYDVTMFEETSDLIGCNEIKQVDYARDLEHPGPLSMTAIAENIAANIS